LFSLINRSILCLSASEALRGEIPSLGSTFVALRRQRQKAAAASTTATIAKTFFLHTIVMSSCFCAKVTNITLSAHNIFTDLHTKITATYFSFPLPQTAVKPHLK